MKRKQTTIHPSLLAVAVIFTVTPMQPIKASALEKVTVAPLVRETSASYAADVLLAEPDAEHGPTTK